MSWPNSSDWRALNESLVVIGEEQFKLETVDCGTLKMPSGKLVCCDPFAEIGEACNPYIEIPPGAYKVVITLADVSEKRDGSDMREAYASLIIDGSSKEKYRQCLEPIVDSKIRMRRLRSGEFLGFEVDAEAACFVDAASIDEGLFDDDFWYEELFENDSPNCWAKLKENPGHIREGIANINLPIADQEHNLVLFHSGWGDGIYPVIGGYNSSGQLVSVHIDFFVVSDPESELESEVEPQRKSA